MIHFLENFADDVANSGKCNELGNSNSRIGRLRITGVTGRKESTPLVQHENAQNIQAPQSRLCASSCCVVNFLEEDSPLSKERYYHRVADALKSLLRLSNYSRSIRPLC